MNRQVRGLAFGMARALLVMLCFTMDVKVRADVMLRSTVGQVEVEKDGVLKQSNPPYKINEPVDIQTFEKSYAKLSVNSIFVGLSENTYFYVSQNPDFTLHHGKSLIRTAQDVRIQTPQGLVNSAKGEFVISVSSAKTTLSVVTGLATLTDRGSHVVQRVRPGFSAWLGGLLASGTHIHGRTEACAFDELALAMKNLGPYSPDEWQHGRDQLRIAWHGAVDQVSTEVQDQVNSDMQLLAEQENARARRERARKAETVYLKKLFRKKVLDEPRGNGEDPWESDRAPASDD